MTPTLQGSMTKPPPNILIVDDSSSLRDCVREILQAILPAARVREAEDGTDALQALTQFPADLIISDLNMPGMDGRALLGALRQSPDWRQVPVLVVSGEDLHGMRLENGGDPHLAFLEKPVSAVQLGLAVQALLDGAARP
jgi:two-component system chemotaxis response regulator CheY